MRALATVVLLALAACGGAEGARPLSALLITLDTTRADALGAYGREPSVTPELDRMAREGVLYTHAFTTAPITLTAHASLLTGLFPPRHGLRDNGIAALPQAARTLAEAARERGLATAAFVGAVVLDRAFGLDQGFEHYDGAPPPSAIGSHPGERPAREVIDGALAWLAARDRARPFFLWVHLYDAHHPYAPAGVAQNAGELERYLGEVAEVDAELGRLFAQLREEGLFETTLVCATADHGEAFGEHEELTHGVFCWNTTLRVPLLLRYPDGRRAGERPGEVVSVADVAPTLADALGLDLGDALDGRSLLAPPLMDRGVYFESYAGHLAFGWSPLSGWLDACGKYVHSSRPEFFDWASDPAEEHGLAAEAAHERYRAALGDVTARPALARDDEGREIDEALKSGVRALGYAAAEEALDELPAPLAPSDRPSPNDMAGAWRQAMVAQELVNQTRWPEAEELYARLLERDPENGHLRGQSATCLMRLGRHAEALELLRPLLDGPVVAPQVLYRMGVCQARLGQREEAIASVERALALAPGEVRFQKKLDELRSGSAPSEDGEGDE